MDLANIDAINKKINNNIKNTNAQIDADKQDKIDRFNNNANNKQASAVAGANTNNNIDDNNANIGNGDSKKTN